MSTVYRALQRAKRKLAGTHNQRREDGVGALHAGDAEGAAHAGGAGVSLRAGRSRSGHEHVRFVGFERREQGGQQEGRRLTLTMTLASGTVGSLLTKLASKDLCGKPKKEVRGDLSVSRPRGTYWGHAWLTRTHI